MQDLSRDLRKIEHYEDVLAEVVNTAAKRYENHLYLTPKEKHMLLKVGVCLFLVIVTLDLLPSFVFSCSDVVCVALHNTRGNVLANWA